MAKIEKWDPELYVQGSFIQESRIKKVLKNYQFEPDAQVLDLGCGDGRISQMIATQLPQGRVVGVDRSEEMIAYAQNKYCATTNLSYQVYDALKLDFQNEFTHVMSFFMLHWVRDQVEVLQRVYQALMSAGKILFLLPKGDLAIMALMKQIADSEKWRSETSGYEFNVIFFEDEEYADFLTATKFKIDHLKSQAIPMTLSDLDIFRKFIRALPLFQHHVSADKVDVIVEDITQAYKLYCDEKYQGQLIWNEVFQQIEAHK